MYAYDHWGRPIPVEVTPEDDGRGTFESIMTDENGGASLDEIELFQNLEGDASLIGKALVMFEKDDDTPVMCCVVGHGLPDGALPITIDDD